MKKNFFYYIFFLLPIWAFSQNEDSLLSIIETKVEIESLEFLSQQDRSIGDKSRQFNYDTFKVERTLEKLLDLDPSTHGTNFGISIATKGYDFLLNKYYKLLLSSLNKENQSVLKNAQKAWLNFRDEETKLISLLRSDKYSGGGTIQSMIELSSILSLYKARVIELFNHYDEITNE
ncbi:MAG: hypothetical protein UZ11_BCD004000147 [Bacteroidetes bacterium OLB11]|nr:MAG: hypothetical protein UZ11_BCD004000147 [Bacteroidetes bacterium OLB11]